MEVFTKRIKKFAIITKKASVAKTFAVIVAFTTLLAAALGVFTSCAKAQSVSVEGREWVLQKAIDANSGEIVAYGNANDANQTSRPIVELICTFSNGQMYLTDATNEKAYQGTFSLSDADADDAIYEVSFQGQIGTAVAGETRFLDGSKKATLILSVGGHVLYFFA